MSKDKTVEYINSFLSNDYNSLKVNLELLLKDYERKSSRLDKIIQQSDKQQRQLMQLNEELDSYKKDLELKVEEEIANRKEKEKMLIQQSKLAAMGEMMDAVAHQWRQPIGVLQMRVNILIEDFEDGIVDSKYLEEFEDSMTSQIDHMMNTLNEFRSFFRPNKSAQTFDIKKTIDKVMLLGKDEFMKYKLNIKINEHQKFVLNGIENELKHLLLNIINNSKDAFEERKIDNREIVINIYGDSKYFEIEDNAGGIPDSIIKDIFKANVTTKDETKGTGIGLYMCSQIAQKHNATLNAENTDRGVKFTMKFQ